MRRRSFSIARKTKQRKPRQPAAIRRIASYGRHPHLYIAALLLVILMLMGLFSILVVNQRVRTSAYGQLYSPEQNPPQADVILVLGAGVRADGTPSDMLRDRILQGVALYRAGCAPFILMSGDSAHPESYDEVGVMKQYAIDAGVPAEAILTDPLGLSTAESIDNLATTGDYKTVIIVSQKYHLYRAIFLAEAYGFDAVGSCADLHTYRLQWYRDLREVAARCKDFVFAPLFD